MLDLCLNNTILSVVHGHNGFATYGSILKYFYAFIFFKKVILMCSEVILNLIEFFSNSVVTIEIMKD